MDVLVGTSLFFSGTRYFIVRTGVAQSMIAEVGPNSRAYELFLCFKIHPKMTDASNIVDAVAFEPLMWSIGSTIA